MSSSEFVTVDVQAGLASEDDLVLRFRRAGEDRPVTEVAYETEDGLEGRFRISASTHDGAPGDAAHAYAVHDSSDGVVWLVKGGTHGLRLEHVPSGAVVYEAYLLLARGQDNLH